MSLQDDVAEAFKTCNAQREELQTLQKQNSALEEELENSGKCNDLQLSDEYTKQNTLIRENQTLSAEVARLTEGLKERDKFLDTLRLDDGDSYEHVGDVCNQVNSLFPKQALKPNGEKSE